MCVFSSVAIHMFSKTGFTLTCHLPCRLDWLTSDSWASLYLHPTPSRGVKDPHPGWFVFFFIMGPGVQIHVPEFSKQALQGCAVSKTLKIVLRNLPAMIWPATFPKEEAGLTCPLQDRWNIMAQCDPQTPTARRVCANQ